MGSEQAGLKPFVILDTAQRELREIAAYLSEDCGAPKAAGAFLDAFEEAVARARQFPESFPLSHMPELARQGYRAMLVGRYVALYACRDDMIVVAHVFHQRQDYARLAVGG